MRGQSIPHRNRPVTADGFRFCQDQIEDVHVCRKRDVIRLLVGFGVNPVEAEDIPQEAFLRALRPSDGSTQTNNLLCCLFACAKNLAINKQYRSRRELSVGDFELAAMGVRSAGRQF